MVTTGPYLSGHRKMSLPAILISLQLHLVIRLLYIEAKWLCSLFNGGDDLLC